MQGYAATVTFGGWRTPLSSICNDFQDSLVPRMSCKKVAAEFVRIFASRVR
jgi:hypothetical protein